MDELALPQQGTVIVGRVIAWKKKRDIRPFQSGGVTLVAFVSPQAKISGNVQCVDSGEIIENVPLSGLSEEALSNPNARVRITIEECLS